MSFVIATPEMITTAAKDIASIGSAIGGPKASGVAPTPGIGGGRQGITAKRYGGAIPGLVKAVFVRPCERVLHQLWSAAVDNERVPAVVIVDQFSDVAGFAVLLQG
jgi:hypothetical protein